MEPARSFSIKTFGEADDVYILPRHRLKIPQTNLIPAICFYYGTFAPIHAGHINVLQEAKHYIESLETHELIGAYISPSHSGYLAKKLPVAERISAGHRLAMIHLAMEHLDWVMVDSFEIFQPDYSIIHIILEDFVSRVRSQLPDAQRIDVFFLRGEDALRYQPPENFFELGFQLVYVLNREGNEHIIDKTNEFRLTRDTYDQQWQRMLASSTFPER